MFKLDLPKKISHGFWSRLALGLLTSVSLIPSSSLNLSAQAQTQSYCQFTPQAIAEKDKLLQTALAGSPQAQKSYQDIINKHKEILRQCRSRTWPQEQAIWVRLYPCDIRPGSIDRIMDLVVNKGYNTVYIETFFDSQVLLPPADNPTPWISVVRTKGYEKTDLLAEAIQKARQRGLKPYAWLFTMNFGYTYAQRADRQDALARNGKGEDTLNFVHDRSQAFIDPYNKQAQTDYYNLVQAVLKRSPDGVLFDYIRYPRGSGTESLVSSVKDLWIYGTGSQQALLNRAKNSQGRALIQQYVNKGSISVGDVAAVEKQYPQDSVPLWQGRNPSSAEAKATIGSRQQRLQTDLWYLTVAHAAQGVIDFLSLASYPVQRRGLAAGAVFFPDGNQVVGSTGFDSRLQAWDQFPPSLEWHPMSYALCGQPSCIVNEVRRVISMASPQTKIVPVLAGYWGRNEKDRPSLDAQMAAIRSSLPQINAVSHFALSWQEPKFDQERRFCELSQK